MSSWVTSSVRLTAWLGMTAHSRPAAAARGVNAVQQAHRLRGEGVHAATGPAQTGLSGSMKRWAYSLTCSTLLASTAPLTVTTVARWRHCARTAAPLQSNGKMGVPGRQVGGSGVHRFVHLSVPRSQKLFGNMR